MRKYTFIVIRKYSIIIIFSLLFFFLQLNSFMGFSSWPTISFPLDCCEIFDGNQSHFKLTARNLDVLTRVSQKNFYFNNLPRLSTSNNKF